MNVFRRLQQPSPARISQAQNGLGLRLLSRLAQDDPQANVCLSPSGLTLALGAAYLAAGGDTRRELGHALGLPGSGTATAVEMLLRWRESLLDPSSPNAMSMATSLWLPPGSVASAAYAEQMRTLQAETATLVGDGGAAADQVNAWASRMTRGRITRIVSHLDPAAALLLITVVDFHAIWQIAFDPQNTHPAAFRLDPGRLADCPMMSLSGDFPYFRTRDLEGIALAYAGGRHRLIVLLPSADRALEELLAELDARAWHMLLERLRPQTGTISLPRFHVVGERSIGGALAALGLGRSLDVNRADFRNLRLPAGSTALGQITQAVRLEVDEEGTEASAVTLMVQVVAVGLPRSHFFEMRVDRPFLFAIEDEPSRTLIFIGAMRDPRPQGGGAAAELAPLEVSPDTSSDLPRPSTL